MLRNRPFTAVLLLALLTLTARFAPAQIAVRGKTVYTMAGPPIKNGIVIIENGKITAVNSADRVRLPRDLKVIDAEVVTPGLIDAHGTVGLTGMLNQDQDQDQLEHSAAIQPELRALDAYNAHDALVGWVRSFGVTTVHTGHAPGELISGQTLIVKTAGNTVEEAVVVRTAALAATLGRPALKSEGKSPGTRGKMMSMLREEFFRTREYLQKRDKSDAEKPAETKLKYEALARVLQGEIPLMVTADRAQDIASALRLAKEFNIKLWLDGAAEAYMLTDEIKASGAAVFVHPPMYRARGDRRNQTFELAARLEQAGIPIALQSGFESYVPKTRVVLFEAAIAAANGLSFEQALSACTIDAARILGIDKRVGSLEVGKDADLALYDGDPFEYTTHCTGVIINGKLVSDKPR